VSLRELARLSSRAQAEGLAFTLDAVGVACELCEVASPGNGHGPLWALLVEEAQLARAQQILHEEGVAAVPASPALPLAEPAPAPRLYWLIGLMVALVAVFVALEGSGGSEQRSVLLRFGASHAPSLRVGEAWRTVTAVFLHIGGQHLAANLGALLVLGWLALKAFGVGRFYFIFVVTGVAGNWISFLLDGGPAVKAGASGAILGLFGALAGARLRQLRQPTPGSPSRFKTWHVVATTLAFLAFVVGAGPADHAAHLGGLVAGALVGLLLAGGSPGARAVRRVDVLGLALGGVAVALVGAAAALAYLHRG